MLKTRCKYAIGLCPALILALSAWPALAEIIPPTTPSELRQAFINDQTGAEEKYIGKIVNIKGVVVDSGISIYMTPYLSLADQEKGPAEVICVLPRADAEKLPDYKIGQTADMRARVYRQSEKGIVVKECVPADK